ncbi:MAG: YdcF family protein [Acidobacteria bacterium]|nr:YdcF family protein [Acidobacteriota bacterium]
MASDARDEILKRERGGAKRGRRLGRAALLLLAAWPPAAWCVARALVVEVEVAQPEAIVVLSGASDYAERARAAAELFAAGRAPKIILTNDGQQGGWSSAEQRNPFFSELASGELVRAGVPAGKIELVAQTVSSTYDEARAVRDYAAARNMRSLLVLTSAYHSRRAEWTWRLVFSGSGVAFGITTAPAGGPSPAPSLWWLRARGWRAVAAEYPKLIYYRLRYS